MMPGACLGTCQPLPSVTFERTLTWYLTMPQVYYSERPFLYLLFKCTLSSSGVPDRLETAKGLVTW